VVAHTNLAGFELCITDERIYYTGIPVGSGDAATFPENELRPGLISFNDGGRWIAFNPHPVNGFDISRHINRGATILLATGSGRAPVLSTTATEPTASVWTFPLKIEERPRAPRVRLNYHTLLDTFVGHGGESVDRWTIHDTTNAVIDTYRIAIANGREAAASGWGAIRTGTVSDNAGITVQTEADSRGRVAPTQYLIRIAPTGGTSLTPGSAPARVRAAGAARAPSLRVDFRNEIIRARAGTAWQTTANAANNGIAFNDANPDRRDWRNGTEITRESAREGIRIVYGANYVFRVVPTADKPGRPASAWQVINVPVQTTLTVADIMGGALTINNGRLALGRAQGTTRGATVIFDADKTRWGGAPRPPAATGNVNVRVRQNATMRHNPKNAGTATEFVGTTATNEVLVTLAYSPNDRERIALSGISVGITETTTLLRDEIVVTAASAQPAFVMNPANTIPDATSIAAFTVFFGRNPTAAMINLENYVLSGLPAPFVIADDDPLKINVEMEFGSVVANTNNWSMPVTIKTTAAIPITANVTVAATLAIGMTTATPPAPRIPNAAFWSATANRTINFVTLPSATVANVTVTGTEGTALGAPVDVVITLANGATLNAIEANANLAGWFTNIPGGLTAVAKSAVAANGTTVTVTIAGTPIAAATGPMVINIPIAATNQETALTVTSNTNAAWAIAAD
jgi:hypothetical protein